MPWRSPHSAGMSLRRRRSNPAPSCWRIWLMGVCTWPTCFGAPHSNAAQRSAAPTHPPWEPAPWMSCMWLPRWNSAPGFSCPMTPARSGWPKAAGCAFFPGDNHTSLPVCGRGRFRYSVHSFWKPLDPTNPHNSSEFSPPPSFLRLLRLFAAHPLPSREGGLRRPAVRAGHFHRPRLRSPFLWVANGCMPNGPSPD